MKLTALDLKTTYELFPTIALLAALESDVGREVCYTFRVDPSEYEAERTEATGLDQEDTVERLYEKSINVKEDFVEFYNDKINDLGIFEFMHQYELKLYQDPKQVVCSSPNFELMKCTPKKDDLFIIKEEYPGDVVFLY